MDKNALNIDKRHSKNQKKSGFTLIEAIIAAAIIAFAIFATWRVITSSITSITRQDKQIKALHIGQACLGRLEGETFSKVIPENFVATSTGLINYKLNESEILGKNQIVDKNGDGHIDEEDFEIYIYRNGTIAPAAQGWSFDSDSLEIKNISVNAGDEVYVNYAYYHLIDEGGTIPSSPDREGIKERTIKLVNDPGDDEYDIKIWDFAKEKDPEYNTDRFYPFLTTGDYTFNPNTQELTFSKYDFNSNPDEKADSVWIYYLPENSTDLSGPDGAPDGYQDPTDDSVVGVVEGSFWDLNSGSTTSAITPTKRITVTEFWKQERQIRSVKLETFLQR